jgi:hypothetical protein
MVKKDRYPAWSEEDRHSVAENQCPGMINLEPSAASENDREWPERRALLKRGEGLVEMVLSHRRHPGQDSLTLASYRTRERLHSPVRRRLSDRNSIKS